MVSSSHQFVKTGSFSVSLCGWRCSCHPSCSSQYWPFSHINKTETLPGCYETLCTDCSTWSAVTRKQFPVLLILSTLEKHDHREYSGPHFLNLITAMTGKKRPSQGCMWADAVKANFHWHTATGHSSKAINSVIPHCDVLYYKEGYVTIITVYTYMLQYFWKIELQM